MSVFSLFGARLRRELGAAAIIGSAAGNGESSFCRRCEAESCGHFYAPRSDEEPRAQARAYPRQSNRGRFRSHAATRRPTRRDLK